MGKLAIDNKALSSMDTVNDVRQLTDESSCSYPGRSAYHAMFEFDSA